MNRPLRTASLSAALAAVLGIASAGCKQNQPNRDPHAGHDHHPRPEGRVEVDQSAVLPVDVNAGFQREFPGAAVTSVKKLTEDDRVVRYEVHVRSKDGKDAVQVFDADGKKSSKGSGAGAGQ